MFSKANSSLYHRLQKENYFKKLLNKRNMIKKGTIGWMKKKNYWKFKRKVDYHVLYFNQLIRLSLLSVRRKRNEMDNIF